MKDSRIPVYVTPGGYGTTDKAKADPQYPGPVGYLEEGQPVMVAPAMAIDVRPEPGEAPRALGPARFNPVSGQWEYDRIPITLGFK